MQTTTQTQINDYISHRHQHAGQRVQMFMDWCKLFDDYMKQMPHISSIKVTSQDIRDKESTSVNIRRVETVKPRQPKIHKPYNIGQASLNEAFKQIGL